MLEAPEPFLENKKAQPLSVLKSARNGSLMEEKELGGEGGIAVDLHELRPVSEVSGGGLPSSSFSP